MRSQSDTVEYFTVKPLCWSPIVTDLGLVRLRCLTLEGDDLLLQVRVPLETIVDLRRRVEPGDITELTHLYGGERCEYQVSANGHSLAIYRMGEVHALYRGDTTVASRCLPEMRSRVRSHRDVDILGEMGDSHVRYPEGRLAALWKYYGLHPYDRVGVYRRGGDVLHLSRVEGGANLQTRPPKVVAWRSLGTWLGVERELQVLMIAATYEGTCIVWLTVDINLDKITEVSYELVVVRCEDERQLLVTFLEWLQVVDAHRYVGHCHDSRDLEWLRSRLRQLSGREVSSNYDHYEIDLWSYFRRWAPQLHATDLQSLGSAALRSEMTGLSERQRTAALTGNSRLLAQVVSQLVGEVRLLLRLWEELSLERVLEGQASILGCTIPELLHLSDDGLLRRCCYSTDLGLTVSIPNFPRLEITAPTTGVTTNVHRCNYRELVVQVYRGILEKYGASGDPLGLELLSRSQALPCHLMRRLLRSYYPQGDEELLRELGVGELQEGELLVRPDYLLLSGGGLRLLEMGRTGLVVIDVWDVLVTLGSSSWIGLRSDGTVVRSGIDDLTRPFCDLTREVVDDCLRSLTGRVPWPQVVDYFENASPYDFCLHYETTERGGEWCGVHESEGDNVWVREGVTVPLSTLEEEWSQLDLQRYYSKITTEVERLQSLVGGSPEVGPGVRA